MARVKTAEKVAIMTLDAGGTSGVAWGVFDLGLDTVVEVMKERELAGSCEVTGEWYEQAEILSTMWSDFCLDWERLGLAREVVIEDFILRVGRGSSDPSGLMSVRVACAFCGRMGEDFSRRVVWQPPSQAKAFGTSARLKKWDVWVRGSEHQRDAWRHVAVRVAALL